MPTSTDVKIGMTFGRLTILSIILPTHRKEFKRAECSCTCGNTKIFNIYNLLKGKSQSCGCLRKEITSKTATKHGMRHSPEYRLWCAIKSRCYNKNVQCYKSYGGRGIKMHPKWCQSFPDFLDYLTTILGPRPSPKHTLDRIDNNKGYSPGNIRWATMSTQAANKRNKNKYRGVSRTRTRFQAEIRRNGIRYFLGTFKTEKEAAAAYVKKEAELALSTINTNE